MAKPSAATVPLALSPKAVMLTAPPGGCTPTASAVAIAPVAKDPSSTACAGWDDESMTPAEFMSHRTSALIATIGVMLTCGGIYLFPAYSSALAERLALSNTELQAVAAMGNLGLGRGVGPGAVCDRLGPRRALMIGAVIQCAGLGMMGMAYDGVLPGTVVFLAMYNFFLAQGCSLADVAAMKITQACYHREQRGWFVGLMASFFGMSSGAFGLTYKSVFEPFSDQLSLFFYAVALGTLLLQYLCSRGYRGTHVAHPPIEAPVEARRSRTVQVATLAALAAQFAVGISHVFIKDNGLRLLTYLGYALVMASFVVLRFWAWPRWFDISCDSMFPDSSRARDTTAPPSSAPPAPAHAVRASTPTAPEPPGAHNTTTVDTVPDPAAHVSTDAGISLRKAVFMPDFWLLFVSLAGGLCFCMTLLNNLAGVTASFTQDVTDNGEAWPPGGEKHAYLQRVTGALVVLFSCSNVAGRLLVGFLADRFQGLVPRVAWMVAGVALALTGNLLLLVVPLTGALFIAAPLAGSAVGFLFGTSPLSTTELFGLKQFATIWGVMVFGPCFPTVLVATLLAGSTSDAESHRSWFTVKSHRYCVGSACYRDAMLVSLGVGLVALAAAAMLTHRRYAAAPAA
jgi:MFS family permease